MNVFLRKRGADEVRRLGFYDFQAQIQKGEISPDDEIKDKVLTKDEWWPARDLRLFHRLSPTTYEAGHRLQRRNQLEEEENQAREAAAAKRSELAREARHFFRMPGSSDEFVLPEMYRFLRLHDERSLWEYKQAVRFTYFPSFHPPLFVRVSSIENEWKLAAARGPCERVSRTVSNELAVRAIELARRTNLSTMAAEESILGCDGASWMLEFTDKEDYISRKRWSPRARPEPVPELIRFVALAEYMAELSELLKPGEQMY